MIRGVAVMKCIRSTLNGVALNPESNLGTLDPRWEYTGRDTRPI